jgi:hypothetical protein
MGVRGASSESGIMVALFAIALLLGVLAPGTGQARPAYGQEAGAAASEATTPLQPARKAVATQTGSRIPAPSQALQRDLLRRMNLDLAKCVFARRPKEVAALLAQSDQEEFNYAALGYNQSAINQKLALDSCLGAVMSDQYATVVLRFDRAVLRGNLAEVAYLASHRQPLTKTAAWTETIANRVIVPSESQATARAKGDFSDCIVFHDPAGADAVLRTKVASEAELAAVKALVPALSSCLNAGGRLELTPDTVRRYAASGMWARAHFLSAPLAPPAVSADAN